MLFKLLETHFLKGDRRGIVFGEGAVGDAWSACAPSELSESMVLGTASPGWRLNACVPSGLWNQYVCVPSGLWRPSFKVPANLQASVRPLGSCSVRGCLDGLVLRTTLISGCVSKLTSGDFGRISTLSSGFVTSGAALQIVWQYLRQTSWV